MYKSLLEQPTEDQSTETQKQSKKKFYISKNKKKTIFMAPQKSDQEKIWRISASTLTRENSPSHLIPKSKRFSSLQTDRKKDTSFLQLELSKCLDKGISFPQSKRTDHFAKKNSSLQPSSATYFKEDNSTMNWFEDINPEEESKIRIQRFLNTSSGSRKHLNQQGSCSRGHKFNKFEKIDKLFLHHGRQLNYQPEITKNNPGVGKYQINESAFLQSNSSFSFRKILERFNQQKSSTPGPGAYKIHYVKSHKDRSINEKGTFQNSNRQFLVSPNNGVPGPGSYFLQ